VAKAVYHSFLLFFCYKHTNCLWFDTGSHVWYVTTRPLWHADRAIL